MEVNKKYSLLVIAHTGVQCVKQAEAILLTLTLLMWSPAGRHRLAYYIMKEYFREIS